MAPKGSVRDSLVSQYDVCKADYTAAGGEAPAGEIRHTQRLGHPAMGLSPMGRVDPRWDCPRRWDFPDGMGLSPMGS